MAHSPTAERFAAFRYTIFVLFFLVLSSIQSSANAANLKFDVSRGSTGGLIGSLNTVGDDLCPTAATNGCDFDPDDDVVRTNDGVGYKFAIQVDPPGDQVYIDTVLKAGQVWDQLPGICDPFTSTITGDGTAANPSKLHCDLGFRSSFAADLTFVARILGNNPNGASSGIASAEFSGTNSTTLVGDVSSIKDVQVTAQPHYNLQKQIYSGNPTQVDGVDGYQLRYTFWIDMWKHDTNGNTADDPDPIFGNEQVTGPISFVEDMSSISPNAYLFYCPNYPNSTIFPYRTYNSAYPKRSVLDGGTVACSDLGPTAKGQVTVTITDADLSFSHYPTQKSTGSALPGDRKVASFGWLYVFVPLSDITAAGGELPVTNEYTDFNPVSISGQKNYGGTGEDTSDNTHTTVVREGTGSFSHTYRCTGYVYPLPSWCQTSWYSPPTSATGYQSGDGGVEPDQIFGTYTYYRNNSFTSNVDSNVCTVFDARYMDTKPRTTGGEPSYCIGQCGQRDVDYVMEYGVGYVDSSFLDASTTPANAIPDECSTPATNWHSNYSTAQTAGTITKIRMRRLTPLRAGQANALATHFKAKTTAELAGVPSKTLLKTWGTTKNSSYSPASYRECDYVPGAYPTPTHTTDGCGDRMFLNRSLARIEKTTLPNNSVNLLNAGGKINFELSPSFTAVSTSTTDNVTIVDELPVGGEYVAGSAKFGGAPLEPVVTGDAASGYVLTWDLGTRTANDPIDPITFQMSTPLQTANNTVLNNVARIDVASDDSSPEQRGAVRPVTVTAPASMLMGKSVDNAKIQQDGSITYKIDYLNTTTVQFNEMSIIDVLPSDNDGRFPPSNFSGTISLASVTTPSNSAQFYFSKDAPSGISTDPNNTAANDLASGSVKWCPATATHQLNPSATPSSGGASSQCPQTPTEVTAVRLEDTQILESGGIRSFTLSIDTLGNFGGEVYSNQAQGTSDGISLSPQTPFAKTIVEEKPGIGLAKTVANVSGSDITYHLRMDNLGNTAIANASLTDDLDTTFGAGNYTITTQPGFVTAPASGGLTLNTAFTGTGAGSDLLDPAASNVLAVNEHAVISITVTLLNVTDQGSGIGVYQNSAQFTGTSPEGIPLTDKSNNGTNSDTNNNGTGTDSGEDVPTPVTVGLLPAIETIKTADISGFSSPVKSGDEIVYTITVKNTGNVLLNSVALADTLTNNDGQNQSLTSGPTFESADQSSAVGTIKVGETATYKATYLLQQKDIDAGGVSNTATANGTDPNGTKVFDVSDDPTDATGTDDPTKTQIEPAPKIETYKAADTSELSDPVVAGDEIIYTITVVNTGNVSIDNVALNDTLTNKSGTVLTLSTGPSFVSSDNGSSVGNLKVGETATYRATYNLTQADINSLGVSNTVTAIGEDPFDTTVSDTSTDPTDASGAEGPTTSGFTSAPAIETTKTADTTAFSTPVAADDVITYTITVKNTGNIVLDNVALTDVLTNEAGTVQTLTTGPTFVSADNGSDDGDLKVGETATYTATYKLQQADIDAKGISNTVTATGDDPEDTQVSDVSDDPTDATGTNDPTKTAITPVPAIETIKTADTSTFSTPVAADDVITYSITVKNTGNVTLDGIALVDTLTNEAGTTLALTTGPTFASADQSSADGDLLVGETATYTATYKLTQTDIDAGGVSNTATATGQDPSGTDVSDVSDDPTDATGTDDATKTTITPVPAIETIKTADTSAFSGPVSVDDVITYSITVKNTGNVTLDNVALVDTLTNEAGDTLTLTTGPTFVSADQSSADGDLVVGETATYTATYKLTQADIDSKGLSNTATATGQDPSNNEVSDVSDDPADATGTDDPTKTHIFANPELSVLKTADTSGFATPTVVGNEVVYNIIVENIGNVTLDNISLVDVFHNANGDSLTLTSGPTFVSADLGSPATTLLVGEKATYKASYALTQVDIDSGELRNTVIVTGEDPSDTEVTGYSKDPSDPIPNQPTKAQITPFPELTVLKTADVSGFSSPVVAGDEISYSITVQNTGNVTLSNVVLTDTLTNNNNDTLSLDSGPDYVSSDKGSAVGDLLVGEIATYKATYKLTQADINSLGVSNTVTATGDDPFDTQVSDVSDDPSDASATGADDPTKTSITPAPAIETIKTADTSALSDPVAVGDQITYTITAKNTGNIVLNNVTLIDTLTNNNGDSLTLTSGPTFTSADNSSVDGTLKVGETATYTATYQITQGDIDSKGVTNTATASGQDPAGTEVSDISDDPTDATGTDDKTTSTLPAAPAIETTKTADASAFSTPPAVGNIIVYTIKVKNTGNVTLSNIGLVDTLTNENGDTLALSTGPAFASADAGSVENTLQVNETATYIATYQITQDDIDSTGVSNTVTATADDPSGTQVSDASSDPTDASSSGTEGPTKTPITSAPAIVATKTADTSAFSDPIVVGNKITYTIQIENTGNVSLSNVALADTLTNNAGSTLALTTGPSFISAGDGSAAGSLEVGEIATYTATYALTQDDIDSKGVSNTVTATADDPSGTQVQDVSDDPSDASATGTDDPTNTDITPSPELTALKTANISALSTPVAAGDEITYLIEVKNTGNVTLNSVSLTDTLTNANGDSLTLVAGPDFVSSDLGSTISNLLVGETATYTAKYNLTQADIDSGSLSNSVTADGKDPSGTDVSDISDDPTGSTGTTDDPTKTSFTPDPSMEILKTSDTSAFSTPFPFAGEAITYTITVKNTGNVTLNSIALTDTLTDNDGNVLTLTSGPAFESADKGSSEGDLQVSETATYKATYQITQSDIDSGGVSNTASVDGKDPFDTPVTDESDDPNDNTSTPGTETPTKTPLGTPLIETLKTADTSGFSSPVTVGDSISYSITVKNTGNTTLKSLSLVDTLTNEAGTELVLTSNPTFTSADQGSGEGDLLVGETATYSASYTLTQDDIDTGGISNTVTATATDPLENQVTDVSDDPTDTESTGTDDPTKTAITPEPKLEAIKTADTSALSTPVTPGDVITYTITANNTGNVSLGNVAIVDTMTNDDGASLTLTSGPTFVSADQGSAQNELLVGETATYTSTYELTQSDIDSGGLSNSAVANAVDPSGASVTDTSDDPSDPTGEDDTTKVSIESAPAMETLKTADTSGLSDPVKVGDVIAYTIAVKNTGNVSLSDVELVDTITNLDGTNLTLTNGPEFGSADQSSVEGALKVGETATYSADYTLTQADIDAGGVSNTVTTNAKEPNGEVVTTTSTDPSDPTGTGGPTVTPITAKPDVTVLKTADASGFSTPVAIGDEVTYTITVENTGNVTLSNVSLVDKLTDYNDVVLTLTTGPDFGTASESSSEGTLLVGETATYQATYKITQNDIDAGGIANTVSVSAEGPKGDTVTAKSDDPSDATGEEDHTKTPITMSPAVETLKSADVSGLSSPAKAGETINYLITVKNTGNTTLKEVSVTDSMVNQAGTVLALTNGLDFTGADQGSTVGNLLVGETATYSASYELTQADIDSGGISNSATTSVTDPAGGEITDESSDPSDEDVSGTDTETPTTVTFVPEPSLDVMKSADTSALSSPVAEGDLITYSFTLKNTGNVTLTDVAVADTLTNNNGDVLALTTGVTFGSADAGSNEGELQVGETAVYSATYALTQADINAGGVSNSAAVTATTPSGTEVTEVSTDPNDETDENGPTTTEIDSAPALETLKTADTSALSTPIAVGDVVRFTITVENKGNVTLTNVALTDIQTDANGVNLSLTSGPSLDSSSKSSPEGTLLVGETATYIASYTLTQSDIDAGGISNSVTINAQEPNGETITDTSEDPNNPTGSGGPTTIEIESAPAIKVLKVDDTSGLSSPVTVGDTIVYTITAQNTGNVTLENVALVDTLTRKDGSVLELTNGPNLENSTLSSAAGTLLVGETATYKATYELTQADIDAGGVSNTVSVYGEGPDGDPITEISDDPENPNGEWDQTVTDIEPTSSIAVEKSVASVVRLFPYVYEFIYWVDVKNTGNVTQTNIQLVDDLDAALRPGAVTAKPELAMSGFSGAPETNTNYNGVSDTNTLTGTPVLAPGETGRVQITVRVDFSAGYPADSQGNTAYGTTKLITDPEESNDPSITPENETDTNTTTTPVIDTDGDGSPDTEESESDDRDGDGVADASDYDPTGYFYCEETAKILPGALITVTGPSGAQTGLGTSNNITIMRDGSSGEFQFHVSTAGRYELSYVLPTTGVASTERLPGDPLDLTSLLPSDPASLGGSQIRSTGLLSNFTAAGNPFHIVFDIEANDPILFNNNIPLKHCGNPVATASKSIVGTPVLLASGATQITYLVGVENTGTSQIANVTLTDDLDSVFGSGNHTVIKQTLVSAPVSSGVKENTAFNGSGDVNVLTTGGSLDPGESVKVEFVVDVTPAATGTFTNKVIAGGTSPLDGSPVEENWASVDVNVTASDTLSGLEVAKVAGKTTARIGDILFYTITITNTDDLDRLGLEFVDHLPVGFTYRPGTAKIGDVAVEPVQNGRRLVWPTQDIAGNEVVTLTLHLGVGAGANGKEFINQAWVEDPLTGTRVSTVGKSVVRREIEHVFDCGEIIGKVFDDKNRDGYQNQGEPGLPGVRVVTARGILIKTDKHGRYNVPCAAIPDEKRGSNFIIKLDTRTLPTGYRLTTENPRVVRLTRGKVTKLNFGASITRLVRIDLNSKAFVSGKELPARKLASGIDKLIASLEGREPSAIRLSYHGPENSRKLAKRRLSRVSRLLNQKWKKANGPYRLDVETRFVAGR